MNKALCIGGPKHGQIYVVDDEQFTVMMPRDEIMINFLEASRMQPLAKIDIKIGAYQIGTLVIPTGETVKVWYWMGEK